MVNKSKVPNAPWFGLNAQQKHFCELYASDREFFGHGLDSYVEAYDVDQTKPNWRLSAMSSASRALKNDKICAYINSLLETGGLNDENVDKQLLFTIVQHADFGSKVQAIKEYNKLKQRIVERIDHTTKGKAMPQPIYGGQSIKD